MQDKLLFHQDKYSATAKKGSIKDIRGSFKTIRTRKQLKALKLILSNLVQFENNLLEINQLHIEKYDSQDYLFNIELLKCYEELDWKPELIQFD